MTETVAMKLDFFLPRNLVGFCDVKKYILPDAYATLWN